ncbi:MAG: penicillin-binding protein activator LpoB [Leptospira sp.]|nr:penicillin-binding protein activator LpoB [Leptospira sp.]
MAKNVSFFYYLFLRIVIGTSFLFVNLCSTVSYQNPLKSEGTKQWGPLEIRETVKLMSASLGDYYQLELKQGYFEWKSIQNSTSEHIDTKILSNEILTQLTKKKVPFVDTGEREDSVKEIGFGKTGMVSPETRLAIGKFKSPSHRIKGEINEVVNFERGKKIQYITVTLFLISLETNQIVWSEQSNFLKTSRVEGYGF